jgi:hypothetical protein
LREEKMDKDEQLWIDEPPEGSAAEWAQAYELLSDVSASVYGDDGEQLARTEVKAFVLNYVLRRCEAEAERREPGILKRRLETRLGNDIAKIQEFTDE